MLQLRPAEPADVPLILAFIHELAEYERAPQAVHAAEADLLRDGFGPQPRYQCVLAEWERQPAGFALFLYNYSTWDGRAGIYLEDLFVRPEFRGHGIGRGLLSHLAERALGEGLTRLVWQVLDWNEPAIRFYESIGAIHRKEWLAMRLEGASLAALARAGHE